MCWSRWCTIGTVQFAGRSQGGKGIVCRSVAGWDGRMALVLGECWAMAWKASKAMLTTGL